VHDDNDAIRFEGRFNNVISTTQALQESSDVAAIKLALRMGQDRFYQYIRAFGFGQQSGIELPSETRGLLKPVKRWEPTTIGSIPMGQEIGVTPIQLITMASTIANGGVYLPPHILLKSTELMKGDTKLQPIGFHPNGDLPNPLPDGAHRVISTMTSAEMRKMMEGVVLNGTGRNAQLDGYSAAGKTGTAQKIDVRTHTYSKTKYVASFVGFAPVNNPAISVAIVMDSPEAGGHHGAQASAPAFHELAQQILEYLGVPHDQDLKPQPLIAKDQRLLDEDDDQPAEHDEDINSLFAAVNDLPADDPLRMPQPVSGQAAPVAKNASTPARAVISDDTPVPPVHIVSSTTAFAETVAPKTAQTAPSVPAVPVSIPPAETKGSIVVNAGKRVAVPSLIGQPVRSVVEQAGAAGLGVQILGTGIAREQAPAAGAMVPVGTEIVVRFTR
jgi:cell division protein FtsI (penicillin-binding protein 3)